MFQNSYLQHLYQSKVALLLRRKNKKRKNDKKRTSEYPSSMSHQQNKTPKHSISLSNVVHTTGCSRLYSAQGYQIQKAIFEHSLPVGCYLQAVRLLLLCMGRSQQQVFCFWHVSAVEFMGFFHLFSKEAFIKCCSSPLCIVNSHRLKYKRRKEFLLPAEPEQREYIILMLIAEKSDALYGYHLWPP